MPTLYVRTPAALHAAVIDAARAAGQSLTQYCLGVLSRAVAGQTNSLPPAAAAASLHQPLACTCVRLTGEPHERGCPGAIGD